MIIDFVSPMPVTRIGLRSSKDVSQSECEPGFTALDTCLNNKGCEKALVVPGALPKAAARRITPIGLQSNRRGCEVGTGSDHRDKKRKVVVSTSRQPPLSQVAAVKESQSCASSSHGTSLGEGDMWLSRVQDLPSDRLNGWVISWIFQ